MPLHDGRSRNKPRERRFLLRTNTVFGSVIVRILTFYDAIMIGSTKKWADEGKIDIGRLEEPAAARVTLPRNRFFILSRSPRG
jgi:hypothetical protein